MSGQESLDPRIPVTKSFLRPAHFMGVPLVVVAFLILFGGVTVFMFKWWPGLPISVAVFLAFSWLGGRGPYFMRYLWRNLTRPISYLDT